MTRPFVSRRWPLTLAVMVALAAPSPAHADGDAVLRDCADDGALGKTYARQDLRDAVRTIPADLAEYSDCRQVIGAAAGRAGESGRLARGAGTGGATVGAGQRRSVGSRTGGGRRRRSDRAAGGKRRESSSAAGGRTIVGQLLAGPSGQPGALAAGGSSASGRGLPGWVWSLLAMGGLLAAGGVREGFGGHLERRRS